MYQQKWVNVDDRDYQRILRRDDQNESNKNFKLCTVTYGTVPASFLSAACLQKDRSRRNTLRGDTDNN